MHITQQQKRFAMLSALGLGALVAAQAWRRRDAYDFSGKSVVTTGGSRASGWSWRGSWPTKARGSP